MGLRVAISRVSSPLIWVILIVALLITPLMNLQVLKLWKDVWGLLLKASSHNKPNIWVVVKIMVPFLVPNIVRHLILTTTPVGE